MINDLDPEELQSIKELLYEGKKIQAIKNLRERANAGLKEAKEAIEEYERKLRLREPQHFKRRRGCAGVLLGLVAVVVGYLIRS